MKSLSLLVAVFFAVVSSTGLLAQATDKPCIWDCPQTPFGPIQTQVITLPNGCIVRVHYAYRIACGLFSDLAIVKIENLTNNCSNAVALMLAQVTTEMFRLNPMGFTLPGPNSCVSTYRLTRSTCWRNDTTDCDGDTIAIPCDTSSCCLSEYRICRDSVGVLTVTNIAAVQRDTCDVSEWSCQNTCAVFQKSASQPNESETNVERTSNRLTANPNPAQDQVEISCAYLPKGVWAVDFIDALGRTVSSSSQFVHDPVRGLMVPCAHLGSGSYTVVVHVKESVVSVQLRIQR